MHNACKIAGLHIRVIGTRGLPRLSVTSVPPGEECALLFLFPAPGFLTTNSNTSPTEGPIKQGQRVKAKAEKGASGDFSFATAVALLLLSKTIPVS